MISLTDILEEVVDELDEKYKTKGNLGKWLRQKWVDISRKDKSGKHPPCGASAGKKNEKVALLNIQNVVLHVRRQQ